MKLPTGVSQQFVDNLQGMQTDELKALIVTLQVQNAENEAFKESEQFQAAQERYDEAKAAYQLVAGPIKETTASIKNRTKLVIERLKERGGA